MHVREIFPFIWRLAALAYLQEKYTKYWTLELRSLPAATAHVTGAVTNFLRSSADYLTCTDD
jgi:hypothetical protein